MTLQPTGLILRQHSTSFKAPRLQSRVTASSVPCHCDSNPVSPRLQSRVTASSVPCHRDSRPVSLRVQSRVTASSVPCHCESNLVSLDDWIGDTAGPVGLSVGRGKLWTTVGNGAHATGASVRPWSHGRHCSLTGRTLQGRDDWWRMAPPQQSAPFSIATAPLSAATAPLSAATALCTLHRHSIIHAILHRHSAIFRRHNAILHHSSPPPQRHSPPLQHHSPSP